MLHYACITQGKRSLRQQFAYLNAVIARIKIRGVQRYFMDIPDLLDIAPCTLAFISV
jgi:hypothetical protein